VIAAQSVGQTPDGQDCLIELGQMTNDVFLTVEDFKYSGHGLKQAQIGTNRLAEALRSCESKPEDKDPAGHWGDLTEGFRLSLRLDKAAYTEGEPIVATILARNVSEHELEYPVIQGVDWDFRFLVSDEQNQSVQENRQSEPSGTTGTKSLVVYPRTQRRFVIRLEGRLPLTKPGVYAILAKTKVPKLHKQGLVEISSGTAQIRILRKLGS
jgi:hypothetical protein